MKPGTEKLQMWVKTQTPKAVLVCDAASLPRRELWIPRSLIDYLRITAHPAGTLNYDAIEFTLPEWKINQANLWDFVLG